MVQLATYPFIFKRWRGLQHTPRSLEASIDHIFPVHMEYVRACTCICFCSGRACCEFRRSRLRKGDVDTYSSSLRFWHGCLLTCLTSFGYALGCPIFHVLPSLTASSQRAINSCLLISIFLIFFLTARSSDSGLFYHLSCDELARSKLAGHFFYIGLTHFPFSLLLAFPPCSD